MIGKFKMNYIISYSRADINDSHMASAIMINFLDRSDVQFVLNEINHTRWLNNELHSDLTDRILSICVYDWIANV